MAAGLAASFTMDRGRSMYWGHDDSVSFVQRDQVHWRAICDGGWRGEGWAASAVALVDFSNNDVAELIAVHSRFLSDSPSSFHMDLCAIDLALQIVQIVPGCLNGIGWWLRRWWCSWYVPSVLRGLFSPWCKKT